MWRRTGDASHTIGVYPPTGSTAYEREMSTPPTLLLEYGLPLAFFNRIIGVAVQLLDTGHVPAGPCACAPVWQFLFCMSPVGSGTASEHRTSAGSAHSDT